jgi:hypothetical protein
VLKEYIEKTLEDIGRGNAFLNETLNALKIRTTIEK